MDHKEQRKLAQSIFDKLGLNVDLSGCFDKFIPQLTIDQCVQVLGLVEDKNVCSEWAFNVALIYPEHKDKLIEYVTDSEFAYFWVLNVGDCEIMINRVTESEWAYRWARYIGDRDVMRDRVTESEFAYKWAKDFGDHEIMRDRITEKEFVFKWIKDIKTDKSFFQKKFPEYFEESLVPQ